MAMMTSLREIGIQSGRSAGGVTNGTASEAQEYWERFALQSVMANLSKQEQEDIVREMEREMLKRLLERGKLESKTLNLQLMQSDDGRAP